MRRGQGLLIILVLAATACTRAAAPTTTSTTTTTLATTTTTSSTTTTTAPPLQVAIDGAPEGLVTAVMALYGWAMNPAASPPPPLPEGLAAHLSDLGVTPTLMVSGAASTAPVLNGQAAAVTAGDDVVLAVDEGSGWRVVGAKLASLGKAAWYGPPLRMAFVIGSDARPGEDPPSLRADSLHILTAVPAQKAGAIVGIPRDSWVQTPSGGRSKFTDVMPPHGPQGVLETARSLTGLPLEGYLLTGFAGFDALVNAFGGVHVEIPYRMADVASQAYFEPGPRDLDGGNALAYARNRHIPGGDFTRSLHQGDIIKGALMKAPGQGLGALPQLLSTLTQFVTTDLPLENLVTLAATTYELDPNLVPNHVVPGGVGNVGRASVVFLGEGAQQVFADLVDGMLTPPP
jgi:polyisoprenyl-teichoic acid--peptidoglycan teichoic acid transferase